MAKKAFHLFFSQALIKEPVMFLVAQEFDVLLNIRRARIDQEMGEATIELEGEPDQIDRAEAAFRARGVKVESVLGDIVEG